MDFSGKSTTIKMINSTMPNIFNCQKKFLTPIETLQKMIDQNIWLQRNEFIPLLRKMVETDILNYQKGAPILQDTLWVIKFCARLLADNSSDFQDEINILLDLVDRYPNMDSFYVTTTLERRMERYKVRLSMGKRISRSDKLLLSEDMFEKTEKYYKNIIFNRFPNTQIVDTTFDSPEQVVNRLMGEQVFLNDL